MAEADEPAEPSLRPIAVVIACHDQDRLLAFWSAALGYERGWAGHGYAQIRDPQGQRLPLLFESVDQPDVVPGRVHVDFDAGDMAATVARLRELGATAVEEKALGATRWTVMADPEGNQFCVNQA